MNPSCSMSHSPHEEKPVHPPVHINSVHLPQQDVKYLGLNLYRRLTLHKYIFTERKQLGIMLTKLPCLLRRKSKLCKI
jgi:hypothetical protein